MSEALSLFPIDPDQHVSETPDGPKRTDAGRWGHATVLVGDVRDRLADWTRDFDHGVDFLCTSPPFLALRSYLPSDHPDKHREIGSEPDPATFIDTLLALTADWGRVLAPWGSIAVELGDTFAGSGGAGGDYESGGLREGQAKFRQVGSREHRPEREGTGADGGARIVPVSGGPGWPLAKSLCGIPQAYALSLMYGRNVLNGNESPAGRWRVRNIIVWARPNPPVGSLGKRNVDKRTGDQRFRVATSYITVACRDTGRYFDLDGVREPGNPNSPNGVIRSQLSKPQMVSGEFVQGVHRNPVVLSAPPLDWHADDHPADGDWLWKLPTAPYKGSHYATYPLTLPKRLIEAMCPRSVCTVCGWPRERVVRGERLHRGLPVRDTGGIGRSMVGRTPTSVAADVRGMNGQNTHTEYTTLGWTDCGHKCQTCQGKKWTMGFHGTMTCRTCNGRGDAYRPGITLDPFLGSGTTAAAALALGRDAIGIELDTRNLDLIRQRIRETCEFGTVEER